MLFYISTGLNIFKPIIKPRCNIICTDLENSLIPPSGGELKLLTSVNSENWAQNWLMMISSKNTKEYDEHHYMDLLNLKGMSNMYTSEEYFYIGFFPEGKFCNHGPKYIGLFELEHDKRIFNTKIIVENPNYTDEDSSFYSFKNQLTMLTDSSYIFLNHQELNRPSQIRFYYLWNLN